MPEHPEESLNLIQIFLDRAGRYGTRAGLLYKDKQTGNFLPITWSEWAESVRHTALGLYVLGVRSGDRVAILSENRPQWSMADLGILSLGAATVPIYPTSSCPDIAYLLQNAGVQVLFVSTVEQYQRIKPVIDAQASVRDVILFDPLSPGEKRALSFQTLVERGRLAELNNEIFYTRLVDAVKPDDLATLIYTSGTTGPPKGVMLTHRNFISNYLSASERIDIGETDIALSFLPLCHVFERMAGYYFIAFHGGTIAYAENMQTVPEDMRAVRPTLAAGVPRFYEKVHGRIMENLQASSPLQRRIFEWAMRVGRARIGAPGAGSVGERLSYAIAQALVFRKIRARLGGRLRFFISGGAPLSKELAEFFYAAGILILEGYGLTETSPVIAVNSPAAFKFGTVGQVLANVEVKIVEDGEILTKGPCVMKGYFRNPAATAEVVEDGWFHTGDIGSLDTEGFLRITDRKKDIIATSGGKKVSPQNIEGLVLADKLFSQVVVLGDKRHYLVALVVPNRLEVEAYARESRLDTHSYAELLKNPAIYAWADARFRERTKHLASYEQVKYFALLERELTQENGDLTPTLKVKRKFVMDKYKDVIEELYRKSAVQGADPALNSL